MKIGSGQFTVDRATLLKLRDDGGLTEDEYEHAHDLLKRQKKGRYTILWVVLLIWLNIMVMAALAKVLFGTV